MTFEEMRKKLLEEDAASREKIASESEAAPTPQAQFAELRRQLKTPTTETTGAASKELPQYATDFIKSIYPDPQPQDDYKARLGALEQELSTERLKKEQAAEHRYIIGSPMQMTTPYAPAQSPSAGAGGAYQIGSPTASTSPYQPKEQTQAATKPSESDTRIAELEQAISDLKAEHDRQIYETDMQQISAMSEAQRSALEAVVKGAGTLNFEQYRASSNGRNTLLAAGYTEKEIEELTETYARYLNEQAAQQRQGETQAKVDKSGLSALGQNLLAVPANLLGGAGGAATAVGTGIKQAITGSRYESLDPYNPGYELSQYAGDVRSATRENIEDGNGLLGKAGGMLYGAATSAVDNLARIVVAGPTGSLALAGASSFQDSVRDVSMRGGSAAQAFGMGVATAALEILTEKISLDALIETPSPSSVKQLLKNAAIQGGVEVSEEELNFAASTIADAIIMGDKSNIRRKYNALITDGKSHAEAVNAVMGGLLESAVNTAAESFLSGGMMSGATGTAQYLANRKSGKGGSTGEAQPQTPAAEAQEAPQQPQQAPRSEVTPETSLSVAPTATAEQSDGSAQLSTSVSGAPESLDKKRGEMHAATQGEAPKAVPNAAAGSSSAADIAKMLLDGLQQNNNQQDDVPVKKSADEIIRTFMDSIYKNQQDDVQTGKESMSNIAQTAKDAPSAAGDIAELIDNAKVNGDLSYYQIPNSTSTQKATEYITRKGWEQARMDWTAEVRSGRVSAETTAIGALLLNNAAKAGDKQTYLEVLKDFRAMGTNAAQATQAIRILKQLSPDDRLYMIQRSIDDIIDHARLPQAIIIPDDLKKQYAAAKTEAARDGVISKIQQYVADQLPSTPIEKLNALRYINMLGNFKTQGRNLLGNVGMQIVSEVQNAICVGLEAIANKATKGKYRRTRSLIVGSELYKAAKQDFEEIKTIAMGGGKYENRSTDSFTQGVQDKRTIFRGLLAPLEIYRRATNWAMEFGDEIFSRHSYARALAGYLKANGVTAQQFSAMDNRQKDQARAFAVQEAQEKTFRDSNRLSTWISKVGRRPDTPAAIKIAAEGEAPFRKTPANVAVRAVEYSPLGLIDTIMKGAQAANPNSEVTAQDFLNSASKTLTGTGIYLLGALLYDLGLLIGAPDKDDKQAKFDDALGRQAYSLRLPNATYTIDWAAPLAIPLFMGVETKKLLDQQEIELKDVEEAILSLTAPLISMSYLQAVDDISTDLMYADGDFGQVYLSMALNYLTQGVSNTLLGQIESSVQDVATTTYVDPESPLPDWLQRAIGGVSRKIPGWDYQQTPYRNAFGKTEDSGGLAYNLFSPGYLDQNELTVGRKERERLAGVLGDSGVLYTAPSKTVQINEEDYTLTAQEYDSLKERAGDLAERIADAIISADAYKTLSDEQKAKAIKDAYTFANEQARNRLFAYEYYFGYSSKWMAEMDAHGATIKDFAQTILERNMDKQAQNQTGLTDTQYAKAKEAGLAEDLMTYVGGLLSGLTPEQGKDRVSLPQQMEAITGSAMTEGEKEDWLYWLLSDKQDAKFHAAKELGFDAEDYAVAYRLYRTEEDIGGKGTKARTVAGLMEKFDIDEKTATALYEIYDGSYDD